MRDVKQKYCNEESYSIDAPEKDYLYVKESQIPGSGNGLFTAIPIYKKDIISVFKGTILTSKEAHLRSSQGKDSYFINMPDGSIMDSRKVKCFAKYANDASGKTKTKFKNNAKITLDEMDQVCIVASKNIKREDEIFCSYGKDYWKSNS